MFRILFFAIIFITSFRLMGQNNLIGKWKASCMKEKTKDGLNKVCFICNEIKELKPNAYTIDCEFSFNDKDVSIKADNFVTIKEYELDEKSNTLEFYFEGVELKFQILKTNDPKHIILKNDDNSIIFLTKK